MLIKANGFEITARDSVAQSTCRFCATDGEFIVSAECENVFVAPWL